MSIDTFGVASAAKLVEPGEISDPTSPEYMGLKPGPAGEMLRVRLPIDFTARNNQPSSIANEFPQPGCSCQRCEDARANAASPLMIVNPDGTLEPTSRLTFDQITWFNNLVKMLPERDREIAELKADVVSWSKMHAMHLRASIEAVAVKDSIITSLENRVAELQSYTRASAVTIDAKDARIAELDTELALLRRAAFEDPATPAAPSPSGPAGVSLRKITQYDVGTPAAAEKPSPFRDFRTDPRRMGP